MSPRLRVLLALALAAALALLGLHLAGLDTGLLFLAPAFALTLPLLAGRYPGRASSSAPDGAYAAAAPSDSPSSDRRRGCCRAAGSSSATHWPAAHRPPDRGPHPCAATHMPLRANHRRSRQGAVHFDASQDRGPRGRRSARRPGRRAGPRHPAAQGRRPPAPTPSSTSACPTSATTPPPPARVQFPDGIYAVSYAARRAGRISVKKSPLATPVQTEDGPITDARHLGDVQGQRQGPGHASPPASSRSSRCRCRCPGQPGATLTFPAYQWYSNGELVKWTGPAERRHAGPARDGHRGEGQERQPRDHGRRDGQRRRRRERPGHAGARRRRPAGRTDRGRADPDTQAPRPGVRARLDKRVAGRRAGAPPPPGPGKQPQPRGTPP